MPPSREPRAVAHPAVAVRTQSATVERTVLGIDPGLATTGYGVLDVTPGALVARGFGVIRTANTRTAAERLVELQQAISALLDRYQPGLVAVEKIFFNTNTTTAMAVSQARGVVLAVCGHATIPVHECTPLEVKLAVSGYGRADKRQMQRMVALLLNLKNIPRPDDAADALAVAIWGARTS